jgi:hypothetical protein
MSDGGDVPGAGNRS